MNPEVVPFAHLLTPRAGRMGQRSSAGRDPDRGSTWWGLRPAPTLGKRILLEPGETHVMADLTGAGMIVRLWMTTLLPINNHALRDLIVRFFWDGEAEPSVVCPFGDFFGAPFGRYVQYMAAPMSLTSGGFNAIWPMPYARGARLELRNEGPALIDPIFYQITYYELDAAPESPLRFHAQWRRDNPTQPGIPYTILQAGGRGHYVGCHLAMQNRQWWLRPPLQDILFPYGFGLGILEGQEHTWVDGAAHPARVGTGTEDFFGGAWYFINGPFSAPYHGCTVRNPFSGRVAAYRYDLFAPLPFEESLHVTIDHGFENRQAADYTSVAYWYQAEPHAAFPPLPAAAARRPEAPWLNLVQSGLVLAVPMVALGRVATRLMGGVKRKT